MVNNFLNNNGDFNGTTNVDLITTPGPGKIKICNLQDIIFYNADSVSRIFELYFTDGTTIVKIMDNKTITTLNTDAGSSTKKVICLCTINDKIYAKTDATATTTEPKFVASYLEI